MNADSTYAEWKAMQEAVRKNQLAGWLRAGGDPNRKLADREMTPLLLAVRWHKEKAIRALLAAGADPSPAANFGVHLLHVALGELADEFPDTETWGRCRRANAPASLIEGLIAAGVPTDSPDANWRTPLHRAIARAACPLATTESAFDSAHLLLAKGVPVNRPDRNGVRPLHLAAGADESSPEKTERITRLVRDLLAAGAKVNACDDAGNTPLLNAAHALNPETLQLLLAAGAETDAANKAGDTAFHGLVPPLPPQGNFSKLPARRTQCLRLLLNAGTSIPANLPSDTPLGRALAFLRDHRSDNSPLPVDIMEAIELILPHLQRSETWWSDFMSDRSAFRFGPSLLQNPTVPERLKALLHAASI